MVSSRICLSCMLSNSVKLKVMYLVIGIQINLVECPVSAIRGRFQNIWKELFSISKGLFKNIFLKFSRIMERNCKKLRHEIIKFQF